MPQCNLCGETHATVNPAEWLNREVMMCPGCWKAIEKYSEGKA